MSAAAETFDELPLPDGFAVRSAIVTSPVPEIGDREALRVAVDTSHGVFIVRAAPPAGGVWGYHERCRLRLDCVPPSDASTSYDALLMAVEDEARAAVAEALVAAWGPQ